MKSNIITTVFIVLVAVGLGLALGYVLFGKKETSLIPPSVAETTTPTSEEVWTCSMHPQIRQPELGDCAICGMDLIPLSANNADDDPLVLQMTAAAVALANIQTTIVGAKEAKAAKTISLSGKIQADERLAATQVAHLPGRIEKLFVSFKGERVQKGQALATIYAPDLITAQRELLEALKLQDLNPSLLAAARNKLRRWKIDPKLLEEVETQGEIIETFTLYADATGIVTNRRVAVGDYLQRGEALFDLMSLDKVWAVFDAYEEDLASIALGSQIEFTTPALPNKTFKARVSFIDPLIDPQTRVAAIRTELNNVQGKLKPEMLVAGQLQQKIKSSTQQLTVPKSAVLWTGKKSVVYLKIPDREIPSFQFRSIELGESLGEEYQVLAGLKAGEELVTNGNFSIDAAAQLNNQASMMNQEVKIKKTPQGGIPNFQAVASADFRKAVATLVQYYFPLKDALVQTDAAIATEAAQGFVEALAEFTVSLEDEEAVEFWRLQRKVLEEQATAIAQSKEVEEQRAAFGVLSTSLIKAIEAFGNGENTVYVQYCPMAFDDEGADWLAKEENILNPYFGDKMLRCGFVKKVYEVEE